MLDPEIAIIPDEVAVERGAIGYRTGDLQERPLVAPIIHDPDQDIAPDAEDIGEPVPPEVDEPHVNEPREPKVGEPRVL